MTADPTQLVPWTSTSVQSQQLLGQLYSPLLALDNQSKVIANLADLPQVSGDGLSYTFALKQGVKFSGGSDLTSKDVKYTFDKIKDPATKATSASYFASVATVDAPDPKTVVVHLKTPDASFVTGLTNINTSIVPSDVPVDSLSTKPDGSGPFQFVSRNPNESISLKRNPNYFGGKVGAGNLTFRIIPDKQAMVSALKSGSVQVAIFDDPVVAKTATTSKVEVKTVDSLQIHVLQLRATSPDLSDVNRRLAIQLRGLSPGRGQRSRARGRQHHRSYYLPAVPIGPERSALPDPRPHQGQGVPGQGRRAQRLQPQADHLPGPILDRR